MSQSDFSARYFHDRVDYPDPTQTMLELGVWHEFISETFLNGWINYVEPVRAWVITRYRAYSKNKADVEALAEKKPYHTDLSVATHDDVLLLARSPRKDD